MIKKQDERREIGREGEMEREKEGEKEKKREGEREHDASSHLGK